jgi:phenylacetate-CoA ligase
MLTRRIVTMHAPETLGTLDLSAAYCYERSSYYRSRLDALGVSPGDLRTPDDIAQIPVLIDKERERESMLASLDTEGHPYGMHLCAPLESVVSVASTSGTTGDPTFYPFTREDIALQDRLWALGFASAGLEPGDTVLHAFGLSMFLAGVPVVRALERMGARPIPVGAEAGSEKLEKLVRLTRPKGLCCTPSYAEYLREKYDVSSWGIELIFCAGEPGASLPEVRARIENAFGATVTDMMGGGKGVMSVSCRANSGLHALGQEHWIQQIVDPDTGQTLPWQDGQIGLRVITTFSWHAAPWLRAAPGDICEVFDSPCACGLSTQRYKVVGRADDMLIIKGVKLYPAAVRNLLVEFSPRLTGHFRIDLDAPGPRVVPPLKMRVEVASQDDMGVIDELVSRMHGRFGVTPEIHPVPSGQLPRESHKQQFIEIA